MINTLFNKDEWIFVGKTKYDTDVVHISQLLPREYQFVSVNPGTRGRGRADGSVSAYRNFLVELDAGTKSSQRQYIEKSGLPYSTLVDSAGKSVHAVVCLEKSLASEEEYRKYSTSILACLPKADPVNVNPSRFTRLGGGVRDGKVQQVLEVRERISVNTLNSWLQAQPAYWRHLAKQEDERARWEKMDLANPERTKLTNTTIAFLSEDALPGSRNKALYVAAADFRENGIDYDTAVNELLPIALRLGLTQRESLVTLKSAYRKVYA